MGLTSPAWTWAAAVQDPNRHQLSQVLSPLHPTWRRQRWSLGFCGLIFMLNLILTTLQWLWVDSLRWSTSIWDSEDQSQISSVQGKCPFHCIMALASIRAHLSIYWTWELRGQRWFFLSSLLSPSLFSKPGIWTKIRYEFYLYFRSL